MEWGKKLVVALTSIVLLTGTFILAIFKAPSTVSWTTYAELVGAIAGLFFGTNELSKFIISKYYRPELDKKNGGTPVPPVGS
jgi:hypothetical protein